MKHRFIQYILILIVLTAIAGGYFYFQSKADQKINSSKVNNLTSGLVGYWTFDGADTTTNTATDKSPTGGNNGTINGATPAIGKIGQGLSFDGTNSYITAGTPNLGITNITECAWIYPKNLSGNSIILHYANSTDGDNLFFRIGNGVAGKIDIADENNSRLTSSAALSVNTWSHVCITLVPIAGINNDAFKIYINGNLDNSATANYDPYLVSYSTIGSRGDGTSKFNGYIDEARIYNRALSASEITELYQQGQTKINASEVGKLTNGLTGYWSFDGADTTWTGASTGTVTNRGSLGGTGTMTNLSRSTSPAIGKIGQALNFNAASSQYVSTAVEIRGGAFTSYTGTVSVWVRPTGTPVNTTGNMWYLPAAVSEISNGAFGIHRGTIAGGADKIWAYSTWGSPGIVGTTFTVGEWTHIIWLKSATQLCIYKNGVQVECTSQSDSVSAGSLYIGKSAGVGGAGAYFTGDIDEVRTYNRVLSDSEITELYQQGQTKINASQANKLTNGLVEYLTMDGNDITWATPTAGTIANRGSTGGTKTLSNMSQTITPAIGKIGQALNFDGSNDFISTTTSITATDSYAISLWFKSNGNSSTKMIFERQTEPYSTPSFEGTDAGGYSFYVNNNQSISTGTIAPGRWYHWVGVWNESTGQIKDYLDGSLLDTKSDTTGTNMTTLYLASRNGTSNFFNGSLDEFRIYNRAITQSEVTELYNQGR